MVEFEEKETDLKRASEVAKASVNKAAKDSAKLIKERNKCEEPWDSEGFWGWWARTSPPDNKKKETLPPGKPSGKSSSRSRRRKKPRPNFRNLYLET